MADHPLVGCLCRFDTFENEVFFCFGVVVFLRKLACGLTGYRVLFTGQSKSFFSGKKVFLRQTRFRRRPHLNLGTKTSLFSASLLFVFVFMFVSNLWRRIGTS